MQKEVVKTLKQRLLARLVQSVLGDLTAETGSQSVEILASLIKLSANIKDIRDLINSLPGALPKVDTFERSDLTDK